MTLPFQGESLGSPDSFNIGVPIPSALRFQLANPGTRAGILAQAGIGNLQQALRKRAGVGGLDGPAAQDMGLSGFGLLFLRALQNKIGGTAIGPARRNINVHI